MRLRREIKAYIEAELRDYHQTKADLVDAKANLILQSPIADTTGIRGTDTSKPTESKVIQLITNKRIKRAEQVVQAIDMIISALPEEKFRLIVLKYWTKPQTLTDVGMAMQLNCSRATLYNWTDGILLALAKEMGLID